MTYDPSPKGLIPWHKSSDVLSTPQGATPTPETVIFPSHPINNIARNQSQHVCATNNSSKRSGSPHVALHHSTWLERPSPLIMGFVDLAWEHFSLKSALIVVGAAYCLWLVIRHADRRIRLRKLGSARAPRFPGSGPFGMAQLFETSAATSETRSFLMLA